MALELKQSLNLAQQLVMTPQLQQAIKLLQLSRLELLDTISQEMDENPALEEQTTAEVDEDILSTTPEEKDAFEKEISDLTEVTVEEHVRDDIDWDSFISEYNTEWAATPYEARDISPIENVTAEKTNLHSHLMWQLNMSPCDEVEKEIGIYIIGNLDDDGYLSVTLEEICQIAGYQLESAKKVLEIIQGFDPIGVAARNTQECLLIQAKLQNLNGSIVEQIIRNHMKELEDKDYERIAKKLPAPMKMVQQAVTIIQGMEPKPGRSYSSEETVYITPDIYVVKVGDDYEIVQNEDGLPKLQISNYYKKLLRSESYVPENVKAYIQDKMRSAAWLIKSIHQRQRTIYRVTESIVRFQRDFLDNGLTALKPLVLRDVADNIEMHESTVSRVTTNKYVHTPQGIFELKFFFNSSISKFDGDAVASASVKERIRNIIKAENSAKPCSDQDIADMLKKLNINIARRTVAKYRESMGVLPSRKRRKRSI